MNDDDTASFWTPLLIGICIGMVLGFAIDTAIGYIRPY